MVSRVLTGSCLALQSRCEDKRVQCWGFGATESSGEYVRHECREASSYLGRALQGYCYSERMGILPGVFRRKTASLAMEHLQLKEVLPLISCTLGCRSSVIL